MVGGIVIEVAEVPGRPHLLFVDTQDNKDTCAVLVERNPTSEKIDLGDVLWWQSGYCYWTPQANRGGTRSLVCGTDYDVKIRKASYSGVQHPSRKK